MASADLLRREEEFYESLFDSAKGDAAAAKTRGQMIERKIEALEDMATKERIRAFIEDTTDKDVLVLNVQDPFQRLLLHGVCEVLCKMESHGRQQQSRSVRGRVLPP
ncbi:uncharacterized protein [Triticum aestivum]|uniref:uncharacterized protein isoform X3 n=1 Tax=Triticum aestivum TaxID=4565 RepID=UPI001D01FA06|nr:uncharacterized protein LOC123111205 isoform X3 [Triticum aestivum]